MRPKEVSDKLQLEKIAKDHVWKVEPSCATTGEGTFEGLVRIASYTVLLSLTRIPGMAQQQRQAPTRRQVRHRRPPRDTHLRRVRLHARAILHIPGFLSN